MQHTDMKVPNRIKDGTLSARSLAAGFIEHLGYVPRRDRYQPTVEVWYDWTAKEYIVGRINARTEYSTPRKDVAYQTARELIPA